MPHPRTTIRHAVRDLIRGPDGAERTDAGRKVYASRTVPIFPNMLPAVLVYTTSDSRDPSFPQDAEGLARRILRIGVEAATKGEDADDRVDDLCAQIEDALQADPNLSGAVESVRWVDTDIHLTGDGEDEMVAALTTFEAVYYTAPPETEGTLPTHVYATWEPETGPPHEDDYQDVTETQLPE